MKGGFGGFIAGSRWQLGGSALAVLPGGSRHSRRPTNAGRSVQIMLEQSYCAFN